ncbi:hypothetical protein CSC14_4190 [Proteus mirabilis]|nr:hypothetical protein CSC14_1371 [Proteus mirabilis]PVF84721.1 hypothetical protein CSC14_4190 [Proteus mirabilis]
MSGFFFFCGGVICGFLGAIGYQRHVDREYRQRPEDQNYD